MRRTTDFDVAVIGGGPAGLAAASAVAGTGLRAVVVERQPLSAMADPADDGREIALTHRSVATLQKLGAWSRISPEAVAPMREARVLNGSDGLALSFAADGTARQLGQLVPNRLIRRALFDQVAGHADIDIVADAEVTAVETGFGAAIVRTAGHRTLSARLLVVADSRLSPTRARLGIGAQVHRLASAMLVARVAHEGDHGQVATEWFGHGQSIATLPLAGRRSSVVLVLPAAELAQVAALPAERLGPELTRRYGGRLGPMTVEDGPHTYPLVVTYAHHFAARRAALVGDAAVGMHPVTAHGFNLGLEGAANLGERVQAAAATDGDIGGSLLLRRYEATHRFATAPLYAATNAVVGLFTREDGAARIARTAVLRMGAGLPFVRQAISATLMRS